MCLGLNFIKKREGFQFSRELPPPPYDPVGGLILWKEAEILGIVVI